MQLKRLIGALIVCAFAVPVYASGTVTLQLSSPGNGQIVQPNDVIDWTIAATVSTGDNMGLALISVDLAQDAGNPELFGLPAGDGPPDTIMENFDRPAGIGNPGPGGSGSGYGGTQIDGNLYQIGGAQNTFGASGEQIGLVFNVEPGVGQSGGQTIAMGSFAAPQTPGTYTLRIENAQANVLDEINDPPASSPVSESVVIFSSPTIFFIVESGNTVSASLSCMPASGTVPFATQMVCTLTNLYTGQTRRIAGHIDVMVANDHSYSNWRAGYTNVAAGDSYVASWNQTIPALAAVIGDNVFTLIAEDVTPSPYNQPPYPQAGDTDTDDCTVTAHAP